MFKEFSLISWNVRGFASGKSHRHMHELLLRFKPDMLFLFETHIVSSTSKTFWERHGYRCMAMEEARGHSGGIWAVVSLASRFKFEVVESMFQSISIRISVGAHFCICTGIYANPNFYSKCQLWEYLVDFRSRFTAPWTLIGDFNEILLPSEQRGGEFSVARAERFSNMLQRCGLMDLTFFGSRCTWQRPCRGGRLVSKRLDRAVCDYDWTMNFQETSVEHLVRRHSDHNPLLMCCSHLVSSKEGRPIRFQAAWCTHT